VIAELFQHCSIQAWKTAACTAANGKAQYFSPELAGFLASLSQTIPHSGIAQHGAAVILVETSPPRQPLGINSIVSVWGPELVYDAHNLHKSMSKEPQNELAERAVNVRNRYVPSQLFGRIDEYDYIHRRMALEKFPGFVSHMEASFEVLNRIVVGANYIEKDKWPQHRSLQFMIVADNLRFFYSSFQMLFRGFSNESMILGRCLYEAFVAVIFISCYPNDSNSVIKAGKGQRTFNVTNFIKDDLALGDWMLYHLYSSFAHFNKHDVGTRYVDWAYGKHGLIQMEIGSKQDQMEGALNCLLFMSYAYLRLVVSLFVTSTTKNLAEDLVADAKEMMELYEVSMPQYDKPHWPQMVKDMHYVFEIIGAAEAVKDWKELVKARRSAELPKTDGKEDEGP